jgi:amino acid adenylation domain-containing protein
VTTFEFLSYLRTLNVKVWAEGAKLRYRAPERALSPSLQAELAQRKPEILRVLNEMVMSAQPARLPLRPAPPGSDLPLSFSQQRLWFLDQMEPGNALYNESEAVRLLGPLDVPALERALGEIVRRHEVLRANFPAVDGHPRQIIAPAYFLDLPITDLSELPEGQREDEIRRLIKAEAQRPFDLWKDRLMRVRLLRLGADEHLLIITMHHIVTDRWSIGVLVHEVGLLYQPFVSGNSSPLPELPIQYADYAYWQRRWLSGEALESQLGYWKRQLAGPLPVLEVPADRRRAPFRTFRGARRSVILAPALCRELENLSRERGVTLFMVLLAAFQTLLHRYTGQTDIIVGSPVANRTPVDVEVLIGCFVNTLVLRTDLSGDPSFLELLTRVRDVAVGAYAHQDLPFEKLVEELQPERDLSRTPLFQVMAVLQNAPLSIPKLNGLELQPIEIDPQTAKFDLTLYLTETAKGLRADIEYNTDLFNEDTITRALGHYRRLLEEVVVNPERRLCDIPLLTAGERAQLLAAWNETGRDYPRDCCLSQLVETQAGRTPDAVAVAFEQECITYRELNRRSNQLAHHLRKLGVEPDARVALCVARGLGMVVGALAIVKAGGAYVPLDPEYPIERLTYMLADSAPTAALTHAQVGAEALSALAGAGAPVIDLEADSGSWESESDDNPNRASMGLTSEHLAHVLYTSGSTGKPKGVMVRRQGVINLLRSMLDFTNITSADCALALTTLAFDIAGLELFLPLICGARIALVGAADGHDPESLARTITKCGVTMLQATPATWRMLLESGWRGAPWLKALCTGEALPVELAGRIGKRVGRLWNGYGPTETTIFSSTALVDAATGAKTSVYESIGRPVANTRIYLLDRRCELAPVGVAGEIYIGGVGVARGYMNQPELTAERFVADPFADEANARMYKTGDVGRYLPDGRIEYLGRNDFQVKVRGFRIEPRLTEHPGVREALVVAREEGPGDRRLVAYYTESTAVAVNAETLRAHVLAALPEYMAPAAYVALPALPLTSNGKLDRKALPAPERGAYASHGYEAPVGEIETRLAKIWAEALRLERVGRHDNFFTMGGHSLLAVGLIERMRQEGLHADLRALFTAPTLSALASAAGGDVGIAEVPPNRIPHGCDTITPEMLPLARLSAIDIERIVGAVPGGAANVQDIYPLLPLQEGILFHHLMASEGDMYLAPSLYSVGSRAQLDAYLRALQAVIDRHDMLRTSIHWEGLPQPVQVVWRQSAVVVEEARFDAAGGDVAEQLKARFDPRRYRLDVRQAPLMRVCVAEDAPNRRWMALWLSHHLLGDPIALAVIREEIQAHLLGQVERLPAPLPFRNFVAQALLGAPREEHEAFFRQMLGDVDEPTAPFGLIDAHGDGSGIEAAWRQVAGPLVERLRGVGRGLGVSIASLYHLAWALVLARVSGRDDVVFGTVLFGRMQGSKGADQVVGLLMNTLPVRVRIGDERVEDGVRQTHKLLGELMRHEHAPLALAQRCSGVEPPTPLFSALLNYRYGIGSATTLNQAQSQEQGRTAAAWEEIRFEESDELYKRTNYSLTLNVDDLREGFSLNVQAQSPIDPERVCAYVHTALEQLVEALEGAAETPLRSVDALPAPERRRMLVEWNATHSEYPRGKFIQELFEEQASSAPEAVAVAHQGRQLSYGELNARANRLAHHLRKLGVEPDARVALCAERSLDMVVGLLAILKAGGAYAPLDPAYPIERLRHMLEDSAAMAALTHAQVDREIRSTLAGTGVPVIDLEADAGRWESESDANPDRASVGLSSEHLAYVIYTSGSTGRPKGAMIPHRGICNRLFWMQERYSLTCSDAVLQKTPFSFDVSVWEFFWPLMSGARLVMAKPGGHQDRDYLIEEIERSQITTVHFVPSMLQVFLEGEGLDRLLGLSRVFSSGEALPHELEERFFRLLDAELHNLYGPTEASVDVTYWQCERGGEYQVTPIGRPIANTQIHLLDQHLQPVPLGVAGELHIGGAGLGRGYLARPELTAEKFAPNPFAEEAGARLYKSGDLARYRADENIEFLGRIDHQVKIRGLRIELGEIEEALVRHRSVREAVVVVREDQPGEKRLVAYLTASSGEAVEAGELRAYLKERLPEYMAPAAFAQLERMPLTANGKIDRKALPKPGQDWYGAGADLGRGAAG